jgi:hypothetical protein
MRSILFAIIGLAACLTMISSTAAAQRRDFLTEDEVEIIREAQEIDTRIAVLVHAMDRRFLVLKINVNSDPKQVKEKDVWGALPTGSRVELLMDIKRIMQKSIDDIDNLAARPDSMVVDPEDTSKKKKTYNDIFPKAVRVLAAAAARYEPVLNSEIAKTEEKAEKGIMMDLVDFCTQIAEAVTKLPAELKKDKK